MSIQAVSWVLECTIPDPAAKLVMISLANAYNGKSGRCFPTIEQISLESSCSRSTVKRKLQWLKEMGWIAIHEAWDDNGRQLANSYSIRFDLEPGEGFTMNPRRPTSEPGEGFNCEPPLKEPEEIPEDILSETSSDHARKPKWYPQDFEGFWSEYPRSPNMSKKEAFDAWRKLSDEDKAAAAAAIPGYKAFLAKKPDLETIHACRFISKRRFDGFVSTPAPAKQTERRGWTSGLSDADARTKWAKTLNMARGREDWKTWLWGPPPGQPGCLVPADLLEPRDLRIDWFEEKQPRAA
jgi:hypothetical protein